jgi:hypothetical protein
MEAGEVCGWSWLFPPYRWRFDVQALELTRALVFDGQCLRVKCKADHDLGYVLMQRLAQGLCSVCRPSDCNSSTCMACTPERA